MYRCLNQGCDAVVIRIDKHLRERHKLIPKTPEYIKAKENCQRVQHKEPANSSSTTTSIQQESLIPPNTIAASTVVFPSDVHPSIHAIVSTDVERPSCSDVQMNYSSCSLDVTQEIIEFKNYQKKTTQSLNPEDSVNNNVCYVSLFLQTVKQQQNGCASTHQYPLCGHLLSDPDFFTDWFENKLKKNIKTGTIRSVFSRVRFFIQFLYTRITVPQNLKEKLPLLLARMELLSAGLKKMAKRERFLKKKEDREKLLTTEDLRAFERTEYCKRNLDMLQAHTNIHVFFTNENVVISVLHINPFSVSFNYR